MEELNAVGITNIPHNLSEVVNGTIAILKKGNVELSELMEHIAHQIFQPVELSSYDGVKSAFETGRGRIVMREKKV